MFISLFGWFETRRTYRDHEEREVYIPLWLIRNIKELESQLETIEKFISLFGWFETFVMGFNGIVMLSSLYPSLVDSKPGRWISREILCGQVYIPLWLIRNEIGDRPGSVIWFISLFGWFETALWRLEALGVEPVFISLFGWFETAFENQKGSLTGRFISLFGWFETSPGIRLSYRRSDSLYPSLVDSKRLIA